MERDQQVKPAALGYVSVQSKRRWQPVDFMLIALLASLVTVFVMKQPTIGTSHPRGIDSTRANMLTSPLELYRQAAGSYPTTLDDLHRPPPGLAKGIWGGPYIDSPDKLKDAWGQSFRYKCPGVKNPQQYDLWSAGKDGIDGTRDDTKNW